MQDLISSLGVGKDLSKVSQALVDHDSEDSHLGSTSVLELDRSLVLLPCVGLVVPSKVQKVVSEVTGEFGGPLVVSVGHFHNDPAHSHLSDNLIGKGAPGSESRGDILEAGKTDSGCLLRCNENK